MRHIRMQFVKIKIDRKNILENIFFIFSSVSLLANIHDRFVSLNKGKGISKFNIKYIIKGSL
jgi:hypothetical protein